MIANSFPVQGHKEVSACTVPCHLDSQGAPRQPLGIGAPREPTCLPQVREVERNNGWAGAGLWLEGRGDQPFESILTALQPNLEPVTDTSIPSRRAFPNGNPRASHCRASGYFGGKSYKLFHPKGNPDPRMAEPSEALYTVGA